MQRAPAVLVLAGERGRIDRAFQDQPPKGERGGRYLFMEAGQAAHSIYLQATALGLGTVLVGGFDDAGVSAALQLPESLFPCALMPVGTPSRHD